MRAKDAFPKVSTRIHRAVFRASKGRLLGTIVGLPVAELVTTGRRSGKQRSTMLAVPIVEDDHLVLVASFGGDDPHPAWYRNLNANPRVRVTFAGSTRTMIARTATDQERAQLWPQITTRYRGYARYQQRTERSIRPTERLGGEPGQVVNVVRSPLREQGFQHRIGQDVQVEPLLEAVQRRFSARVLVQARHVLTSL